MSYEKAKEYINSVATKTKSKKIPIIIDCDPGIDDALALLLLSQYKDDFDIKLISSVCGNTPIDVTTKNIQFFAENFFPGVRVAKGSKRPICKQVLSTASDVHGKNGLGGYNIGQPNYPVEPDAVESMFDILSNTQEKITIVTLGPMTNIAKLLVIHPEVKDNINVIYSMIGSIDGTGNITDYSEFNAYVDPEAFDLVVKFKIPMIINPMQLGTKTKISKSLFVNYPVKTIKDDFVKTIAINKNEPGDKDNVYAYDVNTIAALIRPDLYEFIPCDIDVYTSPDIDGLTNISENINGIHKYQAVPDKEKVTKFILDNLFTK